MGCPSPGRVEESDQGGEAKVDREGRGRGQEGGRGPASKENVGKL